MSLSEPRLTAGINRRCRLAGRGGYTGAQRAPRKGERDASQPPPRRCVPDARAGPSGRSEPRPPPQDAADEFLNLNDDEDGGVAEDSWDGEEEEQLVGRLTRTQQKLTEEGVEAAWASGSGPTSRDAPAIAC